VRFSTGSRYRARVEETGARHLAPVRGPDLDDRDLDSLFPERAARKGAARLRWDLHAFVDMAPGQVADLEDALADEPADAILTDATMLCGYLIHRTRGLPWATYGTSISALPDPLVPPFGLGLRASASPLAVARNRGLMLLARRVLFRSVQAAADDVLRAAGIEPDGRFFLDLPTSPHLYLQPGIRSMDYPRRSWPPQLRFVGALLPSTPPLPDALPPWWDEVGAAKRVVLVTQGTVATDPRQLIVPTLRALADEPDTLVLAVPVQGEALAHLPQPLPANVRVAPFTPFGALLPHIDIMVTNGGYGGHLAALREGVPLVVAAGTEEKPEVARRVGYTGVGVDLRTARPTPAQVRDAVHAVLDDPRYGRAAEAVGAQLRAMDAPRIAAELLEGLIRSDTSPTGEAQRAASQNGLVP
jgi:UDP:flavonoid glycosyltransferase YjiC (YdhE family)